MDEARENPQSSGVIVRLARSEADVGAMIAIGRQLLAESPYFSKMPWSEARLITLGRMGLSKGNPGLLMAERGGRLVGVAVVAAGEQFFSDTKLATVQFFYVHPDARGGLAAVKLLRALRHWSADAGAADLLLHVTTGIRMDKTDRFLRRMGFRQTGGNYVLEGV